MGIFLEPKRTNSYARWPFLGANFLELRACELRRITLLRTSVNKDKKGGGIASSPQNRTTRLSIESIVGKSLDRLNPARLAEFVCAAVDVVVPIVRLAHPMPGQSREEYGDSPRVYSLAVFGAFVQVLRQHQVECDGV